jgi:hypothetical protein
MAAAVAAGTVTGIVLVAAFYANYQSALWHKFDPVAAPDLPHVMTVPREENFDYDRWVERWADDRHAEIITIKGHKAAVKEITLGLRGDELRAGRAELVSYDGKYEIIGYGYVPKQALIDAAERVMK